VQEKKVDYLSSARSKSQCKTRATNQMSTQSGGGWKQRVQDKGSTTGYRLHVDSSQTPNFIAPS